MRNKIMRFLRYIFRVNSPSKMNIIKGDTK